MGGGGHAKRLEEITYVRRCMRPRDAGGGGVGRNGGKNDFDRDSESAEAKRRKKMKLMGGNDVGDAGNRPMTRKRPMTRTRPGRDGFPSE